MYSFKQMAGQVLGNAKAEGFAIQLKISLIRVGRLNELYEHALSMHSCIIFYAQFVSSSKNMLVVFHAEELLISAVELIRNIQLRG